MLKKFAKAVGYQASKIGWINREIQAYKNEQEKQRIEREEQRLVKQLEDHHHHWQLIMKGQAMRDVETEKDGRVLAIGMDVGPAFTRMDCVNWGVGEKWNT